MQLPLPFNDIATSAPDLPPDAGRHGPAGELPPEGGRHRHAGDRQPVGRIHGRAGDLAPEGGRLRHAGPPEAGGYRTSFGSGDLPPDPPHSRAFRLQAEGFSFLVHFVRLRRARRYILRVRPDGALRVTIPRGGSRAEAVRFVTRHLSWAARERARQLASERAPARWSAGTTIPIDGVPTPIVYEDGIARVGVLSVAVDKSAPDLRPAIEAALRHEAKRVLPPQLLALAAAHGLTVARVTIRNQRSRWGSCSPDGRIALNFRLLQMPPAVREYVLLHELMHLRHPNHSRRFWRAVEAVCPAYRDAERWLKRTGHDLF